MTDSARAMSRADALAELRNLEASGQILIGGAATTDRVSLDGWDPFTQRRQNGNVAGVVIRYLPSGSKHGYPYGGSAPDRLDPRNALALVRFCEWLGAYHGVTELYHLGITADVDRHGNPRTDCHGQGRAVDFAGVRIVFPDGSTAVCTVLDDWATARDFFRSAYEFIATQWQDRTDGPDPEDTPSAIGERSFIMHPDHPATAPGTPHGREAHRDHIHMQIGVTGTA